MPKDNDSANKSVNNDTNEKKKRNFHSWFDWLQLLATISVPVAIGIFTILQNSAQLKQHRVDLQIAKETRDNELFLSERNRRKDEYLADDQQKEAIHIQYENFLSDLLSKEGLILNDTSTAWRIARFKTLSALRQLNPSRRTFLVQNLFEVGFIQLLEKTNWTKAIIDLRSANLTGIALGILADGHLGYNIALMFHNLAFERTVLRNASFRGLDLSGSIFSHAKLDHADFSLSTIATNTSVWLDSANLVGASFENAVWNFASFDNANLSLANLNGFKCHRCSFKAAQAIGADFTDSQINPFNDGGTTFESANLTDSTFLHSFLNRISFSRTSLKYVNLGYSKVVECDFYYSRMIKTTLLETTFWDSNFTYANLTGVDGRFVRFIRSKFASATMQKIDLIGAIFDHCTFEYVDLSDCHLADASLDGSTFLNSNLANCTGLRDSQIRQTQFMRNTILPNGTVYTSDKH